MFGQAHNWSMPFFDHLFQVRRVAVAQLLDRIDANALEHLFVPGADSLELVEVVHYVLRHLATLPLCRRSAAYRRLPDSLSPQARVPWGGPTSPVCRAVPAPRAKETRTHDPLL